MEKDLKFRRTERLTSKKDIEALFSSGASFYHAPFKVVWLDTKDTGPCPARIAISVPKKMVKKAVTRNQIKRKIRESYRLQKTDWFEHLEGRDRCVDMMIIYLTKEVLPSKEVDRKIASLFRRLQKELND